jgi:PAS domain S-box-containing protein
MARILGYDSPEELMNSVSNIGKQIYADPGQRDNTLRLLEQSDSVSNYECRFRRKDGSIIWGVLQVRGFRDTAGRLIRTEGLLEDISERKQALESLRASEKKFRELYEGSRDGYAMTDITGRFIECNSAFCEMTGYTVEKLQTLTYPDITPEKHHETERELLKNQALKRGYTDVYETEIIKKDGTVFPAESRVHLIRNEAGEPAGFWGFIRDISEKKKLQAEAMLQV